MSEFDRVIGILDDDPGMRRFLAAACRKFGFATLEFSDFEELQASTASLVHLIVDLNMPGRDGMEVLYELAQRGSDVPVLIVSGVDERVRRAASMAATEFGLTVTATLGKPLRLQDLANALLSSAPTASLEHPAGVDVRNRTLRELLDKDAIFPFFQPKHRGASGVLEGFEVLARICFDCGIPCVPRGAIASAGADDLQELTLHMLRLALPVCARMRQAGLAGGIAVNATASSLTDRSFPGQVLDMAHEFAVPPEHITIEVTEQELIERLDVSLMVLTRLRLLGFQLAIDDFGTGHSSMQQLLRTPCSEIKIDKGFVMNSSDSGSLIVVEKTIELAHALDARACAEGVETHDVATALAAQGCDLLQGFLFARPMSERDAQGYVAVNHGEKLMNVRDEEATDARFSSAVSRAGGTDESQ